MRPDARLSILRQEGALRHDVDVTVAQVSVAVEDLEAQRLPLTGFSCHMLGSAADTDDAVQETLVRAYRNRTTYDLRPTTPCPADGDLVEFRVNV